MAFRTVHTGNWQPALPAIGNARVSDQPSDAIAGVNADNYATGGTGTIAGTKTENWRVDRQRPPVGMANLQVQRNGVDPPSSVAVLIVPLHFHRQYRLDDAARTANRRAELESAIRRGLLESYATFLNGTHPDQVEELRLEGGFSA